MEKRYLNKEYVLVPPQGKIYNSLYKIASPSPNQEVSFNWLNIDFPYLHNHDHWEFYVVTSGSYTHIINGISYKMNSGDACLIRPNDLHKLCNDNSKNGHHLAFLFTSKYAAKLFACLDNSIMDTIENSRTPLCFTTKNFPLPKIIESVVTLSSGAQAITEKTLKTKIIIDAIFSDFLIQHFIKTSSFPKWFSDFLVILNDPTIKTSTVELAKHTSYSYSRLSRIFKEYMETTITDYIKKIKIQHACNLLSNTNKTVLEISNLLCYDSISYFNKIFKEQTGLSPTEYRKDNKPTPTHDKYI